LCALAVTLKNESRGERKKVGETLVMGERNCGCPKVKQRNFITVPLGGFKNNSLIRITETRTLLQQITHL